MSVWKIDLKERKNMSGVVLDIVPCFRLPLSKVFDEHIEKDRGTRAFLELAGWAEVGLDYVVMDTRENRLRRRRCRRAQTEKIACDWDHDRLPRQTMRGKREPMTHRRALYF